MNNANTTKHTVGPWRTTRVGASVFPENDDRRSDIYSVTITLCCRPENRLANAQLIAAAPEMYEAGRKIMDTLDLLMVEEQFDILDRINSDDVNALRYALDKAEGKNQH